ncbi:uncharacterized protein LOC124140413 [Haliotis rufescens]|uniref:uncharacterized protein LOC124140413 n=1 Tax=Haliotis rufescens TaxID=6454 RepID=UPI001EAFB577|nr:uncharacterized protein LOC124140413 [Haliotis rufescens]
MASPSSSHESVSTFATDESDYEDYVYDRSRARTRKEDSWRRRYRRRMREDGFSSPESVERRSLSPYRGKKFGKKNRSKKSKKAAKKHDRETKAHTEMGVQRSRKTPGGHKTHRSCPEVTSHMK